MKPMPNEAEFQKAIIELAHLYGWAVAHFRSAMTQRGNWVTPLQGDAKGFPDLVLVRDGVIFAELKSEKGKLTPEQQEWIDLLKAAGQEVYVWRPSDRDDIEVILK